MTWIYPGQAVRRADGSGGHGTVSFLAEGSDGRWAVVAWPTGGETWELLRALVLVREEGSP